MRLSFYILAILRWTWCLPQSLLGACVLLYVHLKRPRDWDWESNLGLWVVHNPLNFSVSLGQFIFLRRVWSSYLSQRLWKHEYGHALQSYYLGPLYLILVGIPSATLNLLARRFMWFDINYYNLYPEQWADKLGGVKRL